MISILVALVLTQTLPSAPQRGRMSRTLSDRNDFGGDFAFFEFAPADGTGMVAACTNATRTGAKGEAMTLTGAGICTNSTSSLATVTVPIAQTGGSGAIGISVDSALTNLVLFPSTLNNVNWGTTQNVGAPTIVSTNNPDPLGGTTASRVQFPATTGAQYSLKRQSLSGAPWSGSCYAKMVSGTGELCLFAGSGTGAVRTALNATTWTRMKHENSAQAGGLFVGTDSADCSAGGAFAAQDVYLWNCQLESGKIVTTPTVTTRVATVVSRALTIAGSQFSLGVSWVTGSNFTANATAFQLYKDADNSVTAYSSATGQVSCAVRIGGSTVTTTTPGLMVANAVNRVACYYDGTNTGACVNGVCTLTAGAITMFTGASTLYLGTRSATGNESNGTMKQLCYDPSATRCSRENSGFHARAGFGDSLTNAPDGPGTGWPDRYTALYPSTPVTNWGLNGATADDIYNTRWLVSGTGRYTDVVVFGGINDIRTTSDSAADIFTRLRQTYDEVLAQGSNLYLVTLWPVGNFAGWTGAKATVLLELNALIRTHCATTARVTCIDAYNSDLRDGANLAAIYDSGDGLHQNQAGSDYLSELIHQVLP